MNYVALNGHIVCLESVRNACVRLCTISIDFKEGKQKTLEIYYSDIDKLKRDFEYLCTKLTFRIDELL